MIRKLLYETKLGDLILWLVEWLTGCMLVPLDEAGYGVKATEKGVAACTSKR